LLISSFYQNKNPAERRTFGRGGLTTLNIAKAKTAVKSKIVDKSSPEFSDGIRILFIPSSFIPNQAEGPKGQILGQPENIQLKITAKININFEIFTNLFFHSSELGIDY